MTDEICARRFLNMIKYTNKDVSTKMNFRIEINGNEIKYMEFCGFSEYKLPNITYYSSVNSLLDFVEADNIIEVCKKNKGIAIKCTKENIEIYNDPFCSVPIYVGKCNNKILVTSEFKDFCENNIVHPDKVGIYETMLYGSGVHDRTIIEEIKQLPAACKVTIFPTNEWIIEPYWNFDILLNEDIKSMDMAVEKTYECLTNIFINYKDKKIIMGLSGGLDSRLSACMLSENVCKENIEFFTFGYSKYIKEYKIAQKVTRTLDMPRPRFFKLLKDDYLNADCVAKNTGGQIGINHSHMYMCIKKCEDVKDKIFISNYYSDAVMGWEANGQSSKIAIEDSHYYEMLKHNNLRIEPEIAEKIDEDLKKIGKRFPKQGNFSGINEFIYVIERNTKFHVRMSALCNELMTIELPYANFELLSCVLSLPIKYRAEKKIEKEIIEQKFFSAKDISSRRYSERGETTEKEYSVTEKIFYKFGYYRMRIINFVNVVLAKCSGSRVQIINPYLTENQTVVLNRYLYSNYLEALRYLEDKKIIKEELRKRIENKEYRTKNTGLKYTLIGLHKTMKMFK